MVLEVLKRFAPAVPETLEEVGLGESLIGDLLLKRLFLGGPQTLGDLADRMAVPFVIVLNIFGEMRRIHLVHVSGSRGYGERYYVCELTEEGEERARSAFERNMYDGPAPVPLADYVASVKAQSIKDVSVTRSAVETAFGDLVLHPEIIEQVGPAINSGQSLFFYGPAGNGKSAMATRITRALGDDVFIPYAVEVDGSIIELYDPVAHLRLPDQDQDADPRWLRIRRPVVVVGGELRQESLELAYSATRGIYEAPYQMKANTGMFLIDDFGRQRMGSAQLLNRWIVPLELGIDFLRLETGRKLEVPFDVLLVFSSNLDPAQLVDEAFLRRIKYKVRAGDPDREMFKQIFQDVCLARGVEFDAQAFDYLVEEHYVKVGRPFRGVHPRDLVDQLVALARFIEVPPRMSRDLLDAAVHSYFLVPS